MLAVQGAYSIPPLLEQFCHLVFDDLVQGPGDAEIFVFTQHTSGNGRWFQTPHENHTLAHIENKIYLDKK